VLLDLASPTGQLQHFLWGQGKSLPVADGHRHGLNHLAAADVDYQNIHLFFASTRRSFAVRHGSFNQAPNLSFGPRPIHFDDLIAFVAFQDGRRLAMILIQAALHGLGIKLTAISDVTPVPHNGCRPPKRRRI